MSKNENVAAFENALKENKELLESFELARKRIAENNEATSRAELLVKAAAEIGYALNIADVERAMAESEELSEDELANVAGGAKSFWCWQDYYCFSLYHTESDGNTRRVCSKNYVGLDLLDKLISLV